MKKTLGLLLAAGLIAQPTAYAETEENPLHVSSYKLVSKKRAGRTSFEYEYRVFIDNEFVREFRDLDISFSTTTDGATLTDDLAELSLLNANSGSFADDTIKVVVDRRTRFNPDSLAVVMTDESIEGVDADENGVRDDVERYIRTEFGLNESEIRLATKYATYQQEILSELYDKPTISFADIENLEISPLCIRPKLKNSKMVLSSIMALTFDTSERLKRGKLFRSKLSGLGLIQVPSKETLADYCNAL